MASWLTLEECRLYAPSIQLDDAALSSAIAQAQAIAESPLGANRFLSLQSFVEVIKIPSDNRVLLSRMPVIDDPPATIQIRKQDWADSFGRSPLNDWILVSPEQYNLDLSFGEIVIYSFFNSSNRRYTQSPSYAYSSYRRPSFRPQAPQIRITYTTGFDFESAIPEVQELKSGLAAIVAMRQSGQYQGLKLMEVEDDRYRVEYMPSRDFSGATGKVGGSLMDELLMVFRKYRPRRFSS